jgi:hypothetical protein
VRRPLVAALSVVALTALGIGLPSTASASATTPAFEKTETVTRTNLVSGKTVVIDKRTVTVSVDTTTNLRDRQGITVSWSGAHPTGGLVADVNSPTAANQEEYPVVLMQCRGVDSTKVPRSQQLSPQTCWTQTPSERFDSDYNTPYATWRFDQYATSAERRQYVDVAHPRPRACFGAAASERWVPFVSASGTVYPGGPSGCAGMPPEATTVGSLSLPGNTTYGVSAPNGKGSASFNVRTAENNASLGCSDTVKCSLVVIPIMGISCDADASGLPAADRPPANELAQDVAKCEATGQFKPGQTVAPGQPADHAVTGAMWWSASNWRNRIVVPLQFAPLSNVCDIVGSKSSVDIYGSELMIQAAQQWAPSFCLNPGRTAIHHVQTGEPQAANLLKAGSINAALVSDPPTGGFGRPVVMAPVAMTGFAISYTIDNNKGQPYGSLKLDARLLAKLMTQSYPDLTVIKSDDAALSKNPLNLAADPEFQALNPGIPANVGTDAAATLLSLSSDSDVLYALTSYLNADPAARAWLNGKPDPWGMVVNPNYKGISLPTDTWPLRDTFEPTSYYRPGVNDCLAQAPVPFLPLVAAPMTRLSYIALAMQFSIANSQVVCYLPSPIPGSTDGAKLVPLGRQTPGHRFMLGIMSLADAQRYQVPMAALQTYVNPTAPENFTTDAGRTFVVPTDGSLRAAATLLKSQASSGTWTMSYDSLLSDRRDEGAYPGSMLVYAALPTTGLSHADATAYAQWIRFAATTGQQPGSGVGELPAGYLPLTAANGLSAQSDYSVRAAAAVAAQTGVVPPLNGGSGGTPHPSGGTGGTPGNTSGSGTSGPSGHGSDGSQPSSSATPTPTPAPTPSPAPVSLGNTVAVSAGVTGLILPTLLALALVFGLLVPLTLWRSRYRRAR